VFFDSWPDGIIIKREPNPTTREWSNITIVVCEFYSFSSREIWVLSSAVSSSSVVCRYLQVSGCRFVSSKSGSAGIKFNNGSTLVAPEVLVVNDNIIDTVGLCIDGFGYEFWHVQISGNQFRASGSQAVNLITAQLGAGQFGPGTLDFCFINNTIIGDSAATGQRTARFEGIFDPCVIGNCVVSASQTGFLFWNSKRPIVKDNHILEAVAHGMQFTWMSDSSVDKTYKIMSAVIEDNVVRN